MRKFLILVVLIMIIPFNGFAQKKKKKDKEDPPSLEMLMKMFETEIEFQINSEYFTPAEDGEGYEDLQTGARLVGIFLPASFEDVLDDFKNGMEDEGVIDSGSFETPVGTGYYNRMLYEAPNGEGSEDFIALLAIIPHEEGTINVSGASPKSLYDEYHQIFLEAAKSAKVKE